MAEVGAGGSGISPRDALDLGEVGGGRARLVVVAAPDGLRTRLLVTAAAHARDAEAGEGVVTALVRRWRAGVGQGRFSGTWRDDGARVGLERRVSTDHANLSIATGDVLVKLLRRPADAAALTERIRHLDEVGFAEVPRALGVLGWAADDNPKALALASRYLPDAQEGWSRFRRIAERGLHDGGDVTAATDALAALGALAARFHLAVATPSSVLGQPVRASTAAERRRWVERAHATLDDALRTARDGAGGDDVGQWRTHATHLLAPIERLSEGNPTPLLRIHGDLHVGQVLTDRGGLYLTDLDGGPDEGGQPHAEAPAARDLAALLRSLDHVGRLAARRGAIGVDAPVVDRWIAGARAVCRSAYVDTLGSHRGRHLLDDALVRPFEAAQAAHELCYAVQHLPEWLAVADAALAAFVEGRADDER